LRSTLHRMRKIPERHTLDVEVVPTAIRQMNLELYASLTANFCFMNDSVCA